MDRGLIWVLAGLALLLAELVVPGVFLLWIGLAAIGTGLLDMAIAPSFGIRAVVFLVLLAGGIATAIAIRKHRRPEVRVNTPDAGLVGRTGTLVECSALGGRVRVGDSDWAARVPDDAAPGDVVRIEGVEGTVLVVRRIARAGS